LCHTTVWSAVTVRVSYRSRALRNSGYDGRCGAVSGMTPDRFQELRGLFERVLDAPEPDRASMVEDVARTDDAMAEELRRMLDAHAQRTSLLDGAALAALHAASRSLPEGYMHLSARDILAVSFRLREWRGIG
jgi:hypothetical protein